MFDNRFAKGRAILGISECRFICSSRGTERLGSDANTPTFKVRERHPVTISRVTEHQIRCEPHFIKYDLTSIMGSLTKFFLMAGDNVARCVSWHDEATQPFLTGVRVSHCEDQGDIRLRTGGNKLLSTIHQIAVTVWHSPSTQSRGIGAGMRLGETKSAELPAARQRLKKALFLLFRSEGLQASAD